MRLKNEVEETTKTIVIEDYSTFKSLLKSQWLLYLLIAYSAYIVINAVLSILDGGYFMGALNLVVHGLVCASLWLFRTANSKDELASFSTKGTKMFQIAHAVKYIIIFILFIVLLFMIIFSWIDAANLAHQEVINLKNSIDETLKQAAKHNSVVTFWKYFGLLIGYLAFMVATCVYYKAVMCFVDGVEKYAAKGTHCWNDLKFLAIYLFVSAGVLVLMSVLMMLGVVDKLFALTSASNYQVIVGGTGVLSCVGRLLFAAICIATGVVCLKGYKTLNTTTTSHEEVIQLED